MPNSATMSPAPAPSMSSISSACMRTRRPTLWRLPVRLLMIVLALLERALVDAQVGELAVAAVFELEGERHERLVGSDASTTFSSSFVEVDARCSRPRAGSAGSAITPSSSELHALVLVGRAHEHRRQLERDRALADRVVDQLLGDLLLEDRLGELVGEHATRVEHLLARGRRPRPAGRPGSRPRRSSRRWRPRSGTPSSRRGRRRPRTCPRARWGAAAARRCASASRGAAR